MKYIVDMKIKRADGGYDSVDFNSTSNGIIDISNGGTGAVTQEEALENILGNSIVPDKNLPLSDYVIETGVSGIWTYRKWNSGKAECWGTYTATGKTMNTAWGNSLYVTSVNSSRIDYPFTFLERPKEYATIHTLAAACFMYTESGGNGLNTTSASAMYSIARPSSSSTSVTAYLDLRVVGNWK